MDLLNPEKPPILVFEDRGRIQFKGLSQVLVKSIAEFQNLYSYACFALKGAPKKGGCEHVRRSHMGLIVHVFSQNGSLVSKVNFVDLAGYEDARKKSSDGSYLAEIKNYTHATGFVKNPSFCQDTIYMVSLASWSCHWICRAFLDSTKRNASSAKQMVVVWPIVQGTKPDDKGKMTTICQCALQWRKISYYSA